MPLIDCGIDIGSTNLKVVFVGEGGRVILTRSVPSPRTHDEFGPVTKPLELVATLENLIVGGWRDLGIREPLRSITAAGVGEDGVGVTADGTPTGVAIPWFDNRAAAEASELQTYRHLAARAGNLIDHTRTAAKWLWLRRRRPEEMAAAVTWVALTDFPAAWWSGKRFMSGSLAPRTACYAVMDRTWIAELIDAVRAPELPPVKNAGEIIGGVRQGPLRDSGAASSETLLVAGGHDHPIAATMIRRFDRDGRVDSMGTANLIYGETPQFSGAAIPETLAFSVPPSGKDLACLGVIELGSALAKLPNPDALRAYLSQERLPGEPPRSLMDMRQPTCGGDLAIRRTLEDMSFKARELLAAMDKSGVPKGNIYTTGGWSRSKAFVELRASIFGQAITALGDLELTAVGAALFGTEAATGLSICPIHQRDMTVVEPVKSWAAAYDELYYSGS